MSWRLGLLRLWIATSLCWVGFWSWHYRINACGPLQVSNDQGGTLENLGWHCDVPTTGVAVALIPIAQVIFVTLGVPALLLIAGIIIQWVSQGFRRSN
ncbi:MAG: hypothetical protein GEU87_17255 [Alphaproteobacteria bacterium]|nr:hypothetical protein [Alphaproteobacteria bacterium]